MEKIKFASIEEIRYAEKLLLPDGYNFEDDKIEIIECNESKDIKACPGSGKTTTLLAKLAILARRMPLENNQGICVLTHTNVAINEIKSKLGHKADILFSYPNHFGTIQSFVDKFLAIPALKEYYGIGIERIDNDIAESQLVLSFDSLDNFKNKLHTKLYHGKWDLHNKISEQELKSLLESKNFDENLVELKTKNIITQKGQSFYINSNESKKTYLKQVLTNPLWIDRLYKKRLSICDKIKTAKKEEVKYMSLDYVNQSVIKDNKNFGGFTTDSGKTFLGLKEKLFKRGIISYQDAYDLGIRYLIDHPELSESFCSRFKCVFVDEMKDTNALQLEIIEKLFNTQDVIVQYFGDPHQAIFRSLKEIGNWAPENPLVINGSKRFGNNIAQVLKTVCIEDNKDLIANIEINSLQPYLLIFDDAKDVLPKYAELVNTLSVDTEEGKMKLVELAKKEQKTIKAVGWVGEPNKDDRLETNLTIQSYFKDFRKNLKKQEKLNYDSLKSFLKKQENASVKFYSNNIITALLHILELEEIKNTDSNRRFTKTTLFTHLKNDQNEFYLKLISKLAHWSNNIHNCSGYSTEVIAEVQEFIQKDFIKQFIDKTINAKSNEFLINEDSKEITEDQLKSENKYIDNVYSVQPIELGTIHSIKGETHIATLLLETSYYGKHESEMIREQIEGIPNNIDKPRKIETLKMAYVAMSRPKYLLCFAVSSSRIPVEYAKANLKPQGWEIIQI